MASPHIDVTPWPAAEQLFRGHGPWLGGDVAYSIPLGGSRHLWLFGDTFIGHAPDSDRHDCRMLNSSVAIQTGDDPETASMEFFWRDGADSLSGSVFSSPVYGVEGAELLRVWPGHGARVGSAVIVFTMEYLSTSTKDPNRKTLSTFDLRDYQATLIENPDDQPADWRLRHLDTPNAPWLWLVGIGGVLTEGEHVYVHAISRAPRMEEDVYCARLLIRDLEAGSLDGLELWCGDELGWLGVDKAEGQALPQAMPSTTEFTIHKDAASGRYLSLMMYSGLDAHVEARWANAITGPWSAPERVYEPPERSEKTHLYAAKAHSAIGRSADGTEFLFTYNTNTNVPDWIRDRNDLYYPHCQRLRVS